jgi:amino acid transporter
MSLPETEIPQAATAAGGLRRNLKLWQVIAVSIGVMAPSLAINLEPQGAVSSVGRAVPLTYLLALVGVLFVSYGFARLAQRFHHSGAVYGLVGATIGPRTGVVSAWALTGTYSFYSLLTAMSVGIFGSSLLQTWGVWHNPPTWSAYLLAVATLLACTWLAIVPARRGTSVVLACEAVTVTLILIGAVVVFVRLIGGNAPGHQPFTMSVFSPAPGTSASSLFIGVVFGFLSFAGFEAAAVFGAEAQKPRRDIPRAIVGTTVVIGVFYLVVATAAMMGFGATPKGVAAFGASPSLMGDLGSSFISPWFGDLVTLGTVISGFSCTLACVVGAARMIYTISRDATDGASPLGQASERYGTPWLASVVVMVAALAGEAIFAWGMSAAPFDVFVWTSTIGTLLLLVVYLLVTVAAVKVLFFGPGKSVPRREIVVPVLALIVLVYTLYKNIHPSGEPNWEPITAAVWLMAALVALVAVPRVTTRLGQRLAADEGLTAPTPEAPVEVAP